MEEKAQRYISRCQEAGLAPELAQELVELCVDRSHDEFEYALGLLKLGIGDVDDAVNIADYECGLMCSGELDDEEPVTIEMLKKKKRELNKKEFHDWLENWVELLRDEGCID